MSVWSGYDGRVCTHFTIEFIDNAVENSIQFINALLLKFNTEETDGEFIITFFLVIPLMKVEKSDISIVEKYSIL
jgi:hypothetical protein